jgi:predicted dehydrogenase
VTPERVLIVGTGSMGQRHLEIVRTLLPNAELAVFSQTGRTAKNARTLSSHSEIEAFRPEISVVANHASQHIETAIFLGNLGSHLLIEKPISSNRKGINKLIKLKNQKNIKILVGYNLRYLTSFTKMQSLLVKKNIGRVLDVRLDVGQSLETWRPGRDYRETTSARKMDGGGVLRELSHELNYLLAFFGQPTWAFASLQKVSELEIDVEDIAHLIVGFKEKSGQNFSATVNLDFIRQDRIRTCTIIGTEGTLEWNLLTGGILKRTLKIPHQQILDPDLESMTSTYMAEWKDLLNAIELDAEPKNTLNDSIRTLNLILTCEKSQEKGSKVRVKPLAGGVQRE